MHDLRDRLKLVLARAQATTAELAALTKVPARTMRALIEARRCRVSIGVVHKLSVGLRCSPDWLVGLSAEEPARASLLALFEEARAGKRVVRPRAVTGRPRSVLITAVMTARTPAEELRARCSSGPTETVSARLRLLLRDAMVSHAELTRVARLPRSFVAELVGRRAIDPEAAPVLRIATALGVSLAWLIGAVDDAPDIASVRRRFAVNGGRVKKQRGVRDPLAVDDDDERPIIAPDEPA